MKKSAKPVLFYSFIIFILLAFFLTGYISTKLKYDQLTKEKVRKEAAVEELKHRHITLTAGMQAIISEERIKDIAINELGMIKRVEPRIVLEVSKEKIEMIEQQLAQEHE